MKWQLILLVIAGGAVINIAVAWACAIWNGTRLDSITVVEQASGDPPFLAHMLESTGSTRVLAAAKVPETAAYRTGLRGGATASPDVGLLPSWAVESLRSELTRDSTANIMDLRAMGWPARSMMLRLTGNMDFNWQLHGGIRLPAERISSGGFTIMRQRGLPLLPLWPGFAVNTVLYAAALWTLFAIPLHARSRLRIRRGQCGACGYPIGASNICTECGKMVNASGVVSSSSDAN